MSNARELRQLSTDALQRQAEELLVRMETLRFGGAEKEKNVKTLRTLRRNRARILTVLHEKGAPRP